MHPRKRKIAIVLLSIGTIVGFASGFASMRGRACARRDAFERHVAEVCVDAARRDDRGEAAGLADPPFDDHDREGGGEERRSGRRHAGRDHERPHGSDTLR